MSLVVGVACGLRGRGSLWGLPIEGLCVWGGGGAKGGDEVRGHRFSLATGKVREMVRGILHPLHVLLSMCNIVSGQG